MSQFDRGWLRKVVLAFMRLSPDRWNWIAKDLGLTTVDPEARGIERSKAILAAVKREAKVAELGAAVGLPLPASSGDGGAPTDPYDTLHMLDVFLALGGTGEEFAEWIDGRAFADAWPQLVAAVAGRIDSLRADSNPPAGVLLKIAERRPAPSPVSEEGPQPLNLDAVQAQVDTWTRQFRPTPEAAADPMADALCIAEEAGEVCRAVLKRSHGKRPDVDWSAQLRDEVGDVVIGLLSLAANEGWSLADAVTERWAEVSQRGATPEQGEGPGK